MAVVVDAAFMASPAGGDDPKYGDDKIRELKLAIKETEEKEHNYDLTEGGAQPRRGLHKAGSAVIFEQESAPTTRNGVALGTVDAGLLWRKTSTKELKEWNGSSWDTLLVANATSAGNSDTVDSQHVTTIGDGLRAKHGSIHATSPTQDTIYTALAPALPNTNDEIAVSGGSSGKASSTIGGINVFSKAVRTGANKITIYGVSLAFALGIPSLSDSFFSVDFVSGSSTTLGGSVSICW